VNAANLAERLTNIPLGNVHFLDHPFTPVPFGKDLYASFGDEFAVPVIGNFDPPVDGGSGTPTGATNPDNRFDVNADGNVNAQDALILINDINTNGIHAITAGTATPPFLDVTQDNQVSAADVLAVINFVNGNVASAAAGEGEGEAYVADLTASVAPTLTPAVAVADSATSVQYAGLLAEPASAPAAGTVQSAAARVDQYFANDAEQADDLSVYAGELADAVLAGAAQTRDAADTAAQDDLLADLAADEGRTDAGEQEEADGFFAQIGRFFRRLV